MQLAPLQQPPGQVAGLHTNWQTPPMQSLPGPQAWQATPPMPHWAAVGGVTQLIPSQQPPGQVAGLHTTWQTPPTQTFPEVRQLMQSTPLKPQESSSESWHTPPCKHCPAPQVVHADVLRVQFALQVSVPPLNPWVTQVLPPRSGVSHCSPGLMTPF
ncbi:MAG: hypothetical protein V1685_04235, partial [Parcubacteria group bacterium]